MADDLKTVLSNCDAKRDHNYSLGADSFTITTREYAILCEALSPQPEGAFATDRDAVRWRTLSQLDPLDFQSACYGDIDTAGIIESLQHDVDEIIDGEHSPQESGK